VSLNNISTNSAFHSAKGLGCKSQGTFAFKMFVLLAVVVLSTNDSAREYLKVPIGNFNLIERDLLLYPLIFLLFIRTIVVNKTLRIGAFGAPLLCIIAIYYIWAIYGFARGNEIKNVFFHIRQVNYLIVYPMFIYFINSRELLLKYLKIMLGCITVAAIITVMLAIHYSQSDFVARNEFFWITGGSFKNFFHIRLAAAFFFNMALAILISIWILRSRIISRTNLTLLISLITIALILTVLRSYWVGTIVSISILFLLSRKRIKTLIMPICMLVFVAVLFFVFKDSIGEYIITQVSLSVDPDSIAFSDRALESQIALDSFQQNIIFGSGVGATIVTSLQSVGETAESSFCHNSYLTILMFFGVIGAIIFIIVAAVIVKRSKSIYERLLSHNDYFGASLVLGCVAGMGGLLACSATAAAMNYSTGYFLIAIVLGLIDRIGFYSRNSSEVDPTTIQ
jgi:O-antigen ligase